MSEQKEVKIINLVMNLDPASRGDKVLLLDENSPLWMTMVVSIIANY